MAQSAGDALVVGGGIVGISCALSAQERGLDVLLCDPGEARRRASYGNAGCISRSSLFPMSGPGLWRNLPNYLLNRDPGLRLRYRKLPRIAPWIAAFMKAANMRALRRAATALDRLTSRAFDAHMHLASPADAAGLIKRQGMLRLYRTEASFHNAAHEREILLEHGAKFEVIEGDALHELEPALKRPFAKGVLYPETGSVSDPGALVEAYRKLFIERGGHIAQVTVEELRPEGEEWVARLAGDEFRARQVVLAAGGWSHAFTRALGYRFPLAVERGYHLHLAPGEGPPLNRPIHDSGGYHMLAPMRQGVRVTSGVELAPLSAPPDTTQIDAAVREARGTLALGAPLDNEPWMGARPSTPDGLPVIGEAPRHRRLFFAFGHGHIGLSNGPITGQVIGDLLLGRAAPFDIAPFSAARF
ncbi:MAG: FAD-binding oxidoreductase [Hyphomicrobiales bacterium]|nr:FAD-binding oxidoreductase [Hyphomicrobiales bacterium]MBV9751477.1 FAD-binding oxidoreductase [Hyphomicrobiales bacterium]